MNEFELIELIRAECTLSRPDVVIGNGDDAAAIVVPSGQALLVCSDTLVAGRHFPLNTRPEDVGWKALAVNLSDLAAMGAKPAHALLALTIPEANPDWLRAFARGFAELAAMHEVALIGGDTTRGNLSVTVTALGYAPVGRALRRSGAQPGDVIAVCGALGRAAAGLRYLQTHPDCGRTYRLQTHRTEHQWVAELDRPRPQIAQGLILREHASSAIDISDGLAADLGHVLQQSGVGADLELAKIPGWQDLCEALGAESATAMVLGGGDDYVLLTTLTPDGFEKAKSVMQEGGLTITAIGSVSTQPGLRILDAKKNSVALSQTGWKHFA